MNLAWVASVPEVAFVRATLIIVMAGVGLDALEVFACRRLYERGAIFGRGSKPGDTLQPAGVPETFASYSRFLNLFAVLDPFVGGRLFINAQALQIVFGVLAVGVPSLAVYAIAAVIAIRLLAMARHGAYGSEGADHMLLILLTSLLLYFLAPAPFAKRAVLWFIAGESLLAYTTAGVVKAGHSQWWKGSAIVDILSTDLFGNSFCLPYVAGCPWLPVLICRTVIVFECLAPLLVFTGPAGCLLFLSMGVLFHVGIAALQGLNLFVFAFVATYPALLLTAFDIQRVWTRIAWLSH